MDISVCENDNNNNNNNNNNNKNNNENNPLHQYQEYIMRYKYHVNYGDETIKCRLFR